MDLSINRANNALISLLRRDKTVFVGKNNTIPCRNRPNDIIRRLFIALTFVFRLHHWNVLHLFVNQTPIT